MAPSVKLGLLALVGVAAAVPHYGQHSKFHNKPSSGGYAGPTGGWGHNSTALPTGTAPVPGDESTTQTTFTSTVKSTTTKTLYATPVPVSQLTSVQAADKPSGGAGSVCGPATVTVTATDKITVTVPAGGASSPPSKPSTYAPEAPKPSAPEAPKPQPPAPEAPKPSAPAPEAPRPNPPAPVEPSKEAKPTGYPTQPAPPAEPTKPAPTQPAPSAPAPSAPAPKPSGSPSSGGKRGLLYRWDGAADAKGFASAGHFGWASNWEADSKGDIGGIEFIPTLRSLDRAESWASAIDAAAGAGTKVVFTFNEPDKAGQANMSPGAACDAWKQYVSPLVSKHSGIKFVAPSVSSSQSPGEGLDWFTTFKSQCAEAKFAAANFHWYGTPADGFDAFKAHIEDAHAKTGLDFYVTEFAVNNASGEQSAEFLAKAQAYLDSHPNCLGYSYFAVGTFSPDYGMTAENLLGNAQNLTPAGKVYVA